MAKSYLDHDGLAYFWDLIKSKLAQKLNASDAVTGVKGSSESAYRKGDVNITKANIGLGNVTNDKQVIGNTSGTVGGHLVEWGVDGYHLQDAGLGRDDLAHADDVVNKIKLGSSEDYVKGVVEITKADLDLSNVTNDKQVIGNASGTIKDCIVTWGDDGYHLQNAGFSSSEALIPHLSVDRFLPTNTHITLTVEDAPSALFNSDGSPEVGQRITIFVSQATPQGAALSTSSPLRLSIKTTDERTHAADIYTKGDNSLVANQIALGDVLLLAYQSDVDSNGAVTPRWNIVGRYYSPATYAVDGLMSSDDKVKLDKACIMPYIATTNTAASAALTGVCPKLDSLEEGQSIILHLSYAAGSNATLDLILSGGIETGPINLYYGGTTRLGTQYAAGNDIRLTYHENLAIAGAESYTGWWAEGNKDTTYSNATTSKAGLMTAADKVKLNKFSDADDYALKTDISTMYKYKGSLDDMAALQAVSAKEVGDVYNVETDGANYAWNGTEWDSLGGIFEITNITQAQIDAIVAS